MPDCMLCTIINVCKTHPKAGIAAAKLAQLWIQPSSNHFSKYRIF